MSSLTGRGAGRLRGRAPVLRRSSRHRRADRQTSRRRDWAGAAAVGSPTVRLGTTDGGRSFPAMRSGPGSWPRWLDRPRPFGTRHVIGRPCPGHDPEVQTQPRRSASPLSPRTSPPPPAEDTRQRASSSLCRRCPRLRRGRGEVVRSGPSASLLNGVEVDWAGFYAVWKGGDGAAAPVPFERHAPVEPREAGRGALPRSSTREGPRRPGGSRSLECPAAERAARSASGPPAGRRGRADPRRPLAGGCSGRAVSAATTSFQMGGHRLLGLQGHRGNSAVARRRAVDRRSLRRAAPLPGWPRPCASSRRACRTGAGIAGPRPLAAGRARALSALPDAGAPLVSSISCSAAPLL